MKQNVTFSDFYNSFQAIRPDNFSYDGLRTLYTWLELYEEDTGEEVELDVITLCYNFSEYTLEELQTDYGDYEGEQWETMDEAVEWLNDRTMVIPIDNDTVIVQAF
jgi:hypothetical protein